MSTKKTKPAEGEEREFTVVATVTISVTKTLRAVSPRAAIAAAKELAMPGLCFQCATGDDDEWDVGEFDGIPSEFRVEE